MTTAAECWMLTAKGNQKYINDAISGPQSCNINKQSKKWTFIKALNNR
jgi:hypothetical protein